MSDHIRQELEACHKLLLDQEQQLKYQFEQLLQLSNLATIGEMTPQVVHEIRSPMSAVSYAISNLNHAADITLKQSVAIVPKFTEVEQKAYWGIVEQLKLPKENLSLPEKKKHITQLSQDIEPFAEHIAEEIAEKLVLMGIYNLNEDLKLFLKNPDIESIIDLLYQNSKIWNQLQVMEKAIRRINTIIDVVLGFYRDNKTTEEVKPFSLRENIENTLSFYSYRLHNIEIVMDIELKPIITGYPEQLTQVWTNLLSNAEYAIQQRIKTEQNAQPGEIIKYRGKIQLKLTQDGNHIVVQFEDNGTGIDTNLLDKVFEKDFTTKPKGQGTGLGLYICRKILDKHQATISVESQYGKTIFRVVFLNAVQ